MTEKGEAAEEGVKASEVATDMGKEAATGVTTVQPCCARAHLRHFVLKTF